MRRKIVCSSDRIVEIDSSYAALVSQTGAVSGLITGAAKAVAPSIPMTSSN
jgi:hypothetical protein